MSGGGPGSDHSGVKRSQEEGGGRSWRGAIAGGGKRSQVEGSDGRCIERSDQR